MWGFFYYFYIMNYTEKFFCNRDPDDTEILLIRNLLKKIDLEGYLHDNFIYILLEDELGKFEILSFENDYVYIASRELKVNNKMAIEYLIEKIEIDQEYNKLLYESNIGHAKKYKVVLQEKLTRKGLKKIYGKFNIYAMDVHEATRILNKIGYFNYQYIEDVSQTKEQTDNKTQKDKDWWNRIPI